MKAKVLVSQSCLTVFDPTDCSPTGSSIHGIFLAKILEWVTISCSRDLPGDCPFDPGTKHASPALQEDSLRHETLRPLLLYSSLCIHNQGL